MGSRARSPATALLLAIVFFFAFSQPVLAAAATAPPAPSISGTEAQQALDVLTNPGRRAQVVTTLQAIVRAELLHPPAAAPTPAAAKAATETTAAKAVAGTTAAKVKLNPKGLGAAVILGASGFLGDLWSRTAVAAQTVQSLPLLYRWIVVMATNPIAHAILREVLWRLALALAAGLFAEYLVRWLLRRPVAVLEMRVPGSRVQTLGPEPEAPPPVHADEVTDNGEALAEAGRTEPPPRRHMGALVLLRRLPLVFGRLILDLFPVLAFAIAGHIVAGTGLGGTEQSRLVILSMVNAYAITGAIMAFVRMMFSPDGRRLRILRVSDETAQWSTRWIRRILCVAVFGFAIAAVGLALGMSDPAHDGLLKIAGFINHVFLAIMVIEKRRVVKNKLRAPAGATGTWARLRNAVAPVWHWIALFFIVAIWIAWAIELQNGYTEILRFFVTIVVVLALARLVLIVLLGTLERAGHVNPALADRYPDLQGRLAIYDPFVKAIARALVYGGACVVMLEVWGVPLFAWFGNSVLGRRLAAGFGTMFVTLVIAIGVWEAANAAFQTHLARLARNQEVARSARLRTLMPLMRSALLVTIVVIAGLTILSQIGINIGPLLAGAGIIGVAIGFGSQKLVQDLITGIFLLLENAMQVGEYVTVSGLSGIVEALSVRTIRLRATDGSVHIIPFSSVTSVTNTNRGLGNAAVSVTVSYREDTDRVSAILKDIAVTMRAEPDFASRMLSDLQLWGVDKVDGSGATILGQIVCTDSGRWPVQREFNRRLKKRFEEEGVDIFNPARTVVVPLRVHGLASSGGPALPEPAGGGAS